METVGEQTWHRCYSHDWRSLGIGSAGLQPSKSLLFACLELRAETGVDRDAVLLR